MISIHRDPNPPTKMSTSTMKKSNNGLTHLELLYADDWCIAIHKEPGIPCQSKSITSPPPLDHNVEKYLNEPARLWTRIDQPVSGIVLFYRSPDQKASMASSILHKTYFSIVEGHPAEDQTLVSRLVRDGRKRKSIVDPQFGKKAELDFSIVHRFDRYTLLRVTPRTGRFHQIRQQLAQSGFPVKGDVKYGARRKNPDRSIHLHAFQYTVQHGDQPPVSIFDYSFPDDVLWNLARPHIASSTPFATLT